METNKYINGVYVGTIYLHKMNIKIPYIMRGKVKGFTVAHLELITKVPRKDLEKYESDKIKARLKLKPEHKFQIIECETIETNKSYERDSNLKRAN